MNDGYTKIPNDILRCPGLTPVQKLAWSIIAGMKPGYSPTVAQCCEMVPCHPDTWRATVKSLVRLGMVAVEHSANRVSYTAILTPSKWALPAAEGMKISEGEGMKISEGEGMKISEGRVGKFHRVTHSYREEQSKEQIVVDDARARMRSEVFKDMAVENACMSMKLTVEQYRALALEIFCDWEFQDLPDVDWNKNHFLCVLRSKARDLKRQQDANHNRQPQAAGRPYQPGLPAGQAGDISGQLRRDALAAMASLAAAGASPDRAPF